MNSMFEGSVAQQILVPFAGSGAGTAPLTWGQKAILTDMRETGWTHNVPGARPLPENTTVDQVAGQLRRLLTNFPALRTRLATDERGHPYQEAADSGETVLDVFDAPDDADLDQYVYDLWFSRLLSPFDHEKDWPIRMAVVRHRGMPAWQVWTLNHLVADGASIALLMAAADAAEVAGSGAGRSRTLRLLDLGWHEQTQAARRSSDRAMQHWESKLRHAPALTFGEPTHPEGRQGQRFWHGRFHSPAAYLAVLAIAARTGTDTSRVLLALIAIAVARATGVNPFMAKVIVSNRFRPGLAEVVGPLSQNSLVTFDVSDATVDEVVARARHASLVASKHAYYDPDQLDEVSARLDAERGYHARVSCRVNDRRMQTRRAADAAARDCRVTQEQIDGALPKSFVVWDGTVDHLPEQAFITVEDNSETVYLQVIFDMACFTESEVEALLRGVEAVAVEAAFDAKVPTRVPPARFIA